MENPSTNPDDYPKVLVVNASAIFPKTATGITLVNLFQGWPKDRIAQVYDDLNPPCQEICPRAWRVSTDDVPLDRAVRKMLGKKVDTVLGKPVVGLPAGLGTAKGSGSATPRSALRTNAGAWADLLDFRPPKAFWDWIAEFRPEVIYSCLGSIRMMRFVMHISRRFNLPVVPHFMDDWPTTHYASHILAWIPRRALLGNLRKIIAGSPLGMTISEAMAEEYRDRFGIPFEPFMNCVETAAECPALPENIPGKPLKMVYVGGLHLNRWQSIRAIGEALLELACEGLRAEIVIHAPERDLTAYAPRFAGIETIRPGGSLPLEQIPPALTSADLLVHVESFDKVSRQYTRLSISTKIPQYMAAGRPIFAFGPAEAASCRYLQSSGCGAVVETQDPRRLAEALRALLADREKRIECGRRGWEQAVRGHKAEIVRRKFREVLAIAAQRGVPFFAGFKHK
jgi:glycosyltransferase involved in cell wall biosynthesis